MYGLTDVELMKVFADWEGKVIEKIRNHSETDPDVHLYDNYPENVNDPPYD